MILLDTNILSTFAIIDNLTNETRVVNFCKREEIICFNLRMILKKLWSEGIVIKEEVSRMIVEIEDKDNVTILNKEGILS